MTENIAQITQEIDTGSEPENIEVECDPDTGQLVEFHRGTETPEEKTA